MITNNYDLIETNDLNKNSNGGTEQMMRRIYDGKIPRDLLQEFQIIPTRVTKLDNSKYRILYIHDLVDDPQLAHLGNRGWEKFHRIVFVSNWQAQRFIERYQIPWSHCVVLQNAIDPIVFSESERRYREELIKGAPTSSDDKINLIYHTTPHRGLNILLGVFNKLVESHPNIHLHLCSSFKLYGWGDRDQEFKQLFDFVDSHKNITNHGTISNEEIRKLIATCDIFAYPSIWQETSCICLMEAMSAGLQCVHPNYGALYETAANWTMMYNWMENLNDHANLFYLVLNNTINNIREPAGLSKLQSQKSYADIFYNWELRAKMWEGFLKSILESKVSKDLPKEQFVYQV